MIVVRRFLSPKTNQISFCYLRSQIKILLELILKIDLLKKNCLNLLKINLLFLLVKCIELQIIQLENGVRITDYLLLKKN